MTQIERLVFARFVGEFFDGTQIYEFFFSDSPDDVFEVGWNQHQWDSQPCARAPEAFSDHITTVGLIKTPIKLDIITQSSYFDMLDCREGVVALCWENTNDYDEHSYPEHRLVLNWGMSLESFETTMETRDTPIQYKKNGK